MMRRSTGFTIIELTLAMAFISVLLLSIVMTAIQAGRIYNRGAVLRSVNQAGRDVSDTLRRDFLQTNATKIKTDDSAPASPVLEIRDGGEVVSSRFCLGQYSYLWNSPSVLNDPGQWSRGGVEKAGSSPITFVRVDDPSGSFCMKLPSGDYPQLAATDKFMHLLKPITSNDVVIAVYRLAVTKITDVEEKPEQLYRVEFRLGTSATEEIDGASCRPPNDAASNVEFCAINNFDMIVRTNG